MLPAGCWKQCGVLFRTRLNWKTQREFSLRKDPFPVCRRQCCNLSQWSRSSVLRPFASTRCNSIVRYSSDGSQNSLPPPSETFEPEIRQTTFVPTKFLTPSRGHDLPTPVQPQENARVFRLKLMLRLLLSRASWSDVNTSIVLSELSGACHSAASTENDEQAPTTNQKNRQANAHDKPDNENPLVEEIKAPQLGRAVQNYSTGQEKDCFTERCQNLKDKTHEQTYRRNVPPANIAHLLV